MTPRIIHRGDIYFVNPIEGTIDSEQRGGRPAVIVSNDTGNTYSPNVEIVFLTTKVTKAKLPTHVPVEAAQPSTALCEAVLTISKTRLGAFYRRCSAEEMRNIDRALMISLGLRPDVQ